MKIKQFNNINHKHNKSSNFISKTTNTTNINILLNIVRQQKKIDTKKKIIFSISLIVAVSVIGLLVFSD